MLRVKFAGWSGVLALGILVAGCGGSGAAPKTNGHFLLANVISNRHDITVQLPGKSPATVWAASTLPEWETPHEVGSFDGNVIVRRADNGDVLDTTPLRVDSETMTTLFVAGRTDGEPGHAAETVAVQDSRRSFALSQMNFRFANLKDSGAVDVYLLAPGEKVADREPDVENLGAHVVAPLLHRPVNATFTLVLARAGTKTVVYENLGVTTPERAGYWVMAVTENYISGNGADRYLIATIPTDF